MDIEKTRAEGITQAGIILDFGNGEWLLKRSHRDWTEHLVWAVPRDSGWRVLAPSSGNPFDLADVLADGLTEGQAVLHLVEIGGNETQRST